jgi:GTPase
MVNPKSGIGEHYQLVTFALICGEYDAGSRQSDVDTLRWMMAVERVVHHEASSHRNGRTSTASTHLMGFRSTGEPIAGKDQVRAKRKTEDEVARESYRVITLMDLAGHEKYLKTTYVMLLYWRMFRLCMIPASADLTLLLLNSFD